MEDVLNAPYDGLPSATITEIMANIAGAILLENRRIPF